jgi:hypothetical protein
VTGILSSLDVSCKLHPLKVWNSKAWTFPKLFPHTVGTNVQSYPLITTEGPLDPCESLCSLRWPFEHQGSHSAEQRSLLKASNKVSNQYSIFSSEIPLKIVGVSSENRIGIANVGDHKDREGRSKWLECSPAFAGSEILVAYNKEGSLRCEQSRLT